MSKKMCKHWEYSPSGTKYGERSCLCGIKCPKNTNSNCEIITKKPKAKYKTIKGWAGSITNCDGEKGWAFIEQGIGVMAYPAELRIKVKYLKGGK
jgi:hypothetical protein